MKRKFNFLSLVVIGSLLFTLASCGSDNDDSNDSGTVTNEEQQPETEEGIFRAVLSPLNTSVAGNTSGTVEIVIAGDDIRVKSNVVGAPAGEKHLQNIMLGSACPDMATSDTNGDTFVDINESVPATGPILIPLDSDLSAQLDGMSFGPIANGSGNYVYRRSTTMTQMMSDLQAADPDPNDVIVKLPAGSALNLANRVVLIHGVSSSDNLPDSVSTIGNAGSYQVLPIACGRLVRVQEEGGSESDTTTGGSTTGESDTNPEILF